jgi:hypothetical protein
MAESKPKTLKQLAVEQAKADAAYLATIYRVLCGETGSETRAAEITAAWARGSSGPVRTIDSILGLPHSGISTDPTSRT